MVRFGFCVHIIRASYADRQTVLVKDGFRATEMTLSHILFLSNNWLEEESLRGALRAASLGIVAVYNFKLTWIKNQSLRVLWGEDYQSQSPRNQMFTLCGTTSMKHSHWVNVQPTNGSS
jgi:hypothetical protein